MVLRDKFAHKIVKFQNSEVFIGKQTKKNYGRTFDRNGKPSSKVSIFLNSVLAIT